MKSDSSKFYWKDWHHDLSEHPLEIEGAWIRICCKLHFNGGEMTGTIDKWSRYLGVSTERAKEILDYIGNEEIGDLHKGDNGNITVISRRIKREYTAKENARLRAIRYREKQEQDEKSRRENAVLIIPLKEGNEYFITKKDISEWKEAYPDINVMAELKRCQLWNKDNPKKRKTKHGIRRHIATWLTKASISYSMFPNKQNNRPTIKPAREVIDEIYK